MRKELYNRIKTLLLDEENGLGIKHVDLWNHNVEFIEQETVWDRPAVFIEFCPIRWEAHQRGVSYRAEALVKLHIVTDWYPEPGQAYGYAGGALDTQCGDSEGIDELELSAAIQGVIGCMDGDKFYGFDIVETATNHNHEEIVESIDTYRCEAWREFWD
ncbi:MAG: hypothetical protein J6B30_07145 [Muribaculaceae bacterium]|nr:hypothetical protein [Muribaculaceae bacterium]